MKPAVRWPVHPAPLDGEALSSWLRRIADSYQMGLSELLEHDLGYDAANGDDLDIDPPLALLDLIARRSGVDLNRLREMSLAGWTPWLQDSLSADPAAFDTYVHQLSVLLPPGRRRKQANSPWLAWRTGKPMPRACPVCLEDPVRRGLLLMWGLPLMLSCPDHDCMLEPYIGTPSIWAAWENTDPRPRTASEAVISMDHRTQEALTTGRVELPRRSVHAGVWFRLLRTLLDELSMPASLWGSRARDLRAAWATCGHPVRGGQLQWRPFESSAWPIQTRLLEAAAGTIHLLETGAVTGRGAQAELFVTPPDVETDDGRQGEVNLFARAMAAMEEAVDAARNDPVQAQSLYDLLLYGCRTPGSVDKLRALFPELGIPTESLSYNRAPAPFG